MILTTVHSAKGQEWKSVFVLNVVDGCIPIDLGVGTKDEIDEERRLLFFTHGQNAQGDRHVYASRTRFIPANLLKLFECCTWPVVVAGQDSRPDARQVRIDVGARMRGMWR